ncbi:MAG TPA: serpin family protein [Pirellulaceae bacterium]|nr:serpin family protein [Pirellulaceae bacterium]
MIRAKQRFLIWQLMGVPILGVVLLLAGCSDTKPMTSGESDQQTDQSETTEGTTETPAGTFTHVITTETEYYTTGPQQGRPPDGKLSAGTKVNVVKEAGSYTLVRSEDGVEAYVAADVVNQESNIAMDVSGIVESGNQFALDLYQQLRGDEGNLFFSPSSISTALAMTYAGAAGETEAEMAKTLHFQMPQDQLHDGMKALQAFWTTPDKKKGIRLHLANRLWGQESFEFLPAFLRTTRDNYGAELARLDFATKTEESRQTINGWVEDQTEDKIIELIPPDVLSSDTKLVLTNAVYFKGDWSEPFDEKRTKDEDFHLTATDKLKAPLMHNWNDFRYAAVDGFQVLELPYGDGSLSMVVLLPEKIDGLPDLEANLTTENLQKWIRKLKSEKVKVYLPKFKTTSQFKMSSTLKSMGMVSAFDPSLADFSGMTGGKDLFISAVIHKAFVDVNEEGTEAAAATAVVTGRPAPITEPPVFRADHPFLFMIRDDRNGAILFVGRITNPLD